MEIDSHYTNPKLTKLYDLDSGWSKDREFYLSLSDRKCEVLDLGCGTGLLDEAFAKRGHIVTAVDPSQEMLHIAQLKRAHQNINYVNSSAQEFRTDKTYDLIIMTGHAFQVLMTDADVLMVFDTMKRHLKPNGLIVFESRNQKINWAERWNYDMILQLSGYQVRELRRFSHWKHDVLHFDFIFEFPDEVIRTESKIRFWSRNEIEKHLSCAGFQIESFYGDWERSTFNENISEEMIFLLRLKNKI